MAERPAVPLKPGNAGGGKGPQFKTDAGSSEGPGDLVTCHSKKCSEAADGVTRESEGRSRLSLLRPIRQDQARIFWLRLTPVPFQQRAHRAWTAKTSQTSKRVGSSGGWLNWRLRSGGRNTDRSRSDECSFSSPVMVDRYTRRRHWHRRHATLIRRREVNPLAGSISHQQRILPQHKVLPNHICGSNRCESTSDTRILRSARRRFVELARLRTFSNLGQISSDEWMQASRSFSSNGLLK